MKIINYKNRFKAAFDLLFRPKRFFSNLNRQQMKLVNKSKQAIEEDFEARLRFLFNKEKNALLEPDFSAELNFFELPLRNDLRTNNFRISERGETYKKESLFFAISNPDLKAEDYKIQASQALAAELIKRDFIKTRSTGSTIEFFINILLKH